MWPRAHVQDSGSHAIGCPIETERAIDPVHQLGWILVVCGSGGEPLTDKKRWCTAECTATDGETTCKRLGHFQLNDQMRNVVLGFAPALGSAGKKMSHATCG